MEIIRVNASDFPVHDHVSEVGFGSGENSVITWAMLSEIYIEALLVDEELADQVWEAWEIVEIFLQ